MSRINFEKLFLLLGIALGNLTYPYAHGSDQKDLINQNSSISNLNKSKSKEKKMMIANDVKNKETEIHEIASKEMIVEVAKVFTDLKDSDTRIIIGTARIWTKGPISVHLGKSHHFGLFLHYPFFKRDALSLYGGIGYRLAITKKSLAKPQYFETESSSRFNQSNFDLIGIVNYSVFKRHNLFFSFGPSLQKRSFAILSSDTTLGDDFHSGTALGYFGRVGMLYLRQIKQHKFLSRLYYGIDQGKSIRSGRLKYNDTRVNINPTQTYLGVDIGYLF